MKLKLISSILLLMFFSPLYADNYRSTKKVEFKQEFGAFMQVGVQTGGDDTKPIPIFFRSDEQYHGNVPLTVGGDWGGVDESLPQTFNDGIEAGGLYNFSVGVEVPLFHQFMLMTSFGYQFDEVYGDLTDGSGGNGSFKYSRKVIELIPFYNLGRHRFGLGASYHYEPRGLHREYAADFDLKTTYYFDDAIGATFQYDYLINEHTSVGVKVTQIYYDFDSLSTRYSVGDVDTLIDANCISSCKEVIDASSVGAHLTYHF